MLLRSSARIIEKVLVDLFFDDETEKHIEIAEKDIIKVSYNDGGYKRDVEGKVTKIVSKPSKPPVPPMPPHICPPVGRIDMRPDFKGEGYIIVDGSGVYSGNRVIIYFSHILDCEMIEKYDENLIVKTVSNGAVNRIRIMEGILQVSLDNGLTFVNVKDLLGKDITEEKDTGKTEDDFKKETENPGETKEPETPDTGETTTDGN